MSEQATERFVVVDWEDSAQVGTWHHDEDIPPVGPIRSGGFLYREDNAAVVLVQSMNLTQDGPEVRTVRLAGSLVIPRSAIRKVTELTQKARRRT